MFCSHISQRKAENDLSSFVCTHYMLPHLFCWFHVTAYVQDTTFAATPNN